MRNKILLSIGFLFVTFAFAMAQSLTTDEGVVINGVKWATRNVLAGVFLLMPKLKLCLTTSK
jgi:hypothetical protein